MISCTVAIVMGGSLENFGVHSIDWSAEMVSLQPVFAKLSAFRDSNHAIEALRMATN